MSCTYCRADTATGIYLCNQHTIDLKDLLDRIPDVLADAEDTIAKLDVLGKGSGGGSDPAAGSAAPLNMEASERKRELQEAIQQWARVVLADDTTPGLQDIEPLTYLRMSVDPPSSSEKNPGLRIVQRQDSGDMLAKLSEGARYLLVAIDLPPEVISLGRCPAKPDGHACSGTMLARQGDEYAHCRECGHTEDVATIRQGQAALAWSHFDTLANIVAFLRKSGVPINARSARRWAERGDLVATWCNVADRAAHYSLAEVQATYYRMRERRGRPRKASVTTAEK